MSGLKYGHVVYKISDGMKKALEEVPRRSGMYNWQFLFQGDMLPIHEVNKEVLENYDVIQINLSPVDQVLAPEVRRMLGNNSSTLLIGNNDYVAECWDSWGTHPIYYHQIMDIPDAVFGTEPYQTSQMRDDAYCIPHPTWTKMLKRIGNDELDDRPSAGVLYHWWEGRSYTQSAVLERLRKKYPRLWTRLYAYTGQNDKASRWQKVMYNEHMDLMNYPDFIRSLMRNRFVYENCHFHTYGRTSVDTACLRIPTVGTDRVFSMRKCFPKMVSDPMDARKQLKIMDKILQGGAWLEEQMDYAYDAVEYFSYENSKERYMKMVEETRERLKK